MMRRVILDWLPDYDVSESGEIRRITPAKTRGPVPYVLKGNTSVGYRTVKVMLPDATKAVLRVHRLVCEAFHGPSPSPELNVVAHWDGDSIGNNHYSNLRWTTHQENAGEDARRLGEKRGRHNGRARLNEHQVREIRAKFQGKRGQITLLAKEYDLSHSAMWSIVRGEHWSHVR